MKKEVISSAHSAETAIAAPVTDDVQRSWQRLVRRRSFLQGVGLAGASALPAGVLLAQEDNRLSKGDAALLRFVAAIEAVEADLWQQYNELGGQVDHNDNPNPGNPAYIAALKNLDADMPQYISDNTDDEISHRDFLNAYLKSKGAQPIDFKQFETLPPTKAAGALGHGRLTNLQKLTVDTSWYFRYRSTQNPDLGAKFPQLIDIVNQPAIPLHDNNAPSTIQAIANIAAIHFVYIEQGGSSLYPILSMKASGLEVLRILLSIGGVEIDHFSLWHDKMGNAVSAPVAPFFDPVTGVTFPNFNDPASQHNAKLSQADQTSGQPGLSDQPDPARALPIPQSESAGLLHHPAYVVVEWRPHGHRPILHRRRPFHWAKPQFPGAAHGPGVGSRSRAPGQRGLTARGENERTRFPLSAISISICGGVCESASCGRGSVSN